MSAPSEHESAAASPLFSGPFASPPEAPLEFSDMPHEGCPETPGKVQPDRVFLRDFFNDKLKLPDGSEVEFWGFEDESGRRGFPAPTIRVRRGRSSTPR